MTLRLVAILLSFFHCFTFEAGRQCARYSVSLDPALRPRTAPSRLGSWLACVPAFQESRKGIWQNAVLCAARSANIHSVQVAGADPAQNFRESDAQVSGDLTGRQTSLRDRRFDQHRACFVVHGKLIELQGAADHRRCLSRFEFEGARNRMMTPCSSRRCFRATRASCRSPARCAAR